MSPFRFRNEAPYIYREEEEEESSAHNAIFIAIGAAAGFADGNPLSPIPPRGPLQLCLPRRAKLGVYCCVVNKTT